MISKELALTIPEETDFSNGLMRLRRRRLIEWFVCNGYGSPKQKIRLREQDRPADVEVSGLTGSEFYIDEKRARIASDLSERLRNEFGLSGLAVVLLGSAVHGGVRIRDWLDVSDSGTDFDWGIILDRKFSGNLSREFRKRIYEYGKIAIRNLSAKHSVFPILTSCDIRNPQGDGISNLFGDWAFNFGSADEAFDYLKGKTILSCDDPWMLYFSPSFPAGINERNREHALGGLRRIARTDIDVWRSLTESMLYDYEHFFHLLMPKHLLDAERISKLRDLRIADRTSDLSRKLMASKLRELILPTGDI